jgi:hypothetical protein
MRLTCTAGWRLPQMNIGRNARQCPIGLSFIGWVGGDGRFTRRECHATAAWREAFCALKWAQQRQRITPK